jgi:hypothetical protein
VPRKITSLGRSHRWLGIQKDNPPAAMAPERGRLSHVGPTDAAAFPQPGLDQVKALLFHPGGRELLVQRQAAQIKALPPQKYQVLTIFGRRLLKSASLVIHEPTRHPYNALPFNVRNADFTAKWMSVR